VVGTPVLAFAGSINPLPGSVASDRLSGAALVSQRSLTTGRYNEAPRTAVRCGALFVLLGLLVVRARWQFTSWPAGLPWWLRACRVQPPPAGGEDERQPPTARPAPELDRQVQALLA
jgi:hypothetical protein